jgi:hypothetical protein
MTEQVSSTISRDYYLEGVRLEFQQAILNILLTFSCYSSDNQGKCLVVTSRPRVRVSIDDI